MTKGKICKPIRVFSVSSRTNLVLPFLGSCWQNPAVQIFDLKALQRSARGASAKASARGGVGSNTIGVQILALPMVLRATPKFVKAQHKKKEFSVHHLNKTFCNKKEASLSSKNILQIVTGVKETINKKKLILASNNIVCSISGGQDSIFLLFCLSLLQPQIAFKCNIIWCNHFWQISSFYTTLHLTKSAVAFSFPIVGVLPSQITQSSLFYKTVRANYKKDFLGFANQTQLLKKQLLPLQIWSCLALACAKRSRRFGKATKVQTNLLTCPVFCTGGARSLQKEGQGVKQSKKKGKCTGKKALFGKAWRLKPSFVKVIFAYKYKAKRALAPCPFGARPCPCPSTKGMGMGRAPKGQANLRFASARTKFCACSKGYKKFVEAISEVRARNWRHVITERVYTFYDSKACVYGHTGSDRVETILFNLIRGSGSRGIACLPWKRRHSDFSYNRFFPSYKQVIKKTHLIARTNRVKTKLSSLAL